MSTKQRALDTRELEERVKDMYREVAEEPFNEFHFQTQPRRRSRSRGGGIASCRQLAERLGYPSDRPTRYFDLAAITAGETVVDLGSGPAPTASSPPTKRAATGA